MKIKHQTELRKDLDLKISFTADTKMKKKKKNVSLPHIEMWSDWELNSIIVWRHLALAALSLETNSWLLHTTPGLSRFCGSREKSLQLLGMKS
jgi:hypothetical protein